MVEISFDELDRKINGICSGQSVVRVVNITGQEISLLIKHASNLEKELSELYYQKTFKEAREMGLPTLEEIEKTITDRKLFTEDDKNKIEDLRGTIKGQEVLLAKLTVVPAN